MNDVHPSDSTFEIDDSIFFICRIVEAFDDFNQPSTFYRGCWLFHQFNANHKDESYVKKYVVGSKKEIEASFFAIVASYFAMMIDGVSYTYNHGSIDHFLKYSLRIDEVHHNEIKLLMIQLLKDCKFNLLNFSAHQHKRLLFDSDNVEFTTDENNMINTLLSLFASHSLMYHIPQSDLFHLACFASHVVVDLPTTFDINFHRLPN